VAHQLLSAGQLSICCWVVVRSALALLAVTLAVMLVAS